jgi:SAM-dependent methyltransferase
MPVARLIRRAGFALLLAALGTLALAQQGKPAAPSSYKPRLDQAGKDVEWVPTPQVLVDRMLDIAKVTPADFVMDLGSGDGRTVIAAARRGARALGVEYNPDLVELSRRNARKAGVGGKASFVKADLFETDFSEASVITMFLLPEINLKLRPKILALKPGTRIVSNTFTMDDWEADETVTLTPGNGCSTSYCTALLWIVPARVAGTYRHALGSLYLDQKFQMLSGTMTIEDKTLGVAGKVRGEEITFIAGGLEYSGKLNGKVLELR